MDIYIDQDGKTAGPFRLEEINDKLAHGKLTSDAMAWFQGWNTWLPLNHIPGIIIPYAPPQRALLGGNSRDPEVPKTANLVARTHPPDHDAEVHSASSTPESDDGGVFADDTDLHHRFYRQIVESFREATNRLMRPFDQLDGLLRSQKPISSEGFFQLFLTHAAAFNGDCTAAFATALRQSTQLDGVRGTTVKQLAKEIRSEAFEECDLVLANYHQTINYLMGGVETAVEQADNMGAPMGPTGGALLGSLVAGRGSRAAGAAAGGLAALANTLGTMNRRMALYGQASAMIEEAGRLAPTQVGEYLEAVRKMPVALIDFLGAKCFGGAVDLQQQELCVQVCTKYCDQLVSRALRTMEAYLRQFDEEARKPQPPAQLPRVSFRLGCGGVFCVMLALLGLAFFCSAWSKEPKRLPEGADDVEAAQMVRESQDDRVQEIWWGVGLMVFGLGRPVYRFWKTDNINRERGY